jgi:methyl acetate hydrolase
MEAQLDPIFQAAIDSERVPGVAAVALDASGKVLFSKGYGVTTAGDPNSPPLTPDTLGFIWSCTKLVTSIAALQLVEQGKIDLDEPVETYVPDIKNIKLVQGWNDDGSPKLTEPSKKIKMIHLFTHTSGMAYDFFDPDILKWRMYKNDPPCAYGTRSAMAEYTTPLIFEPGSAWNYGTNNDWMGFVVEKISGLTLAEYMSKHIFQPLGLRQTGTKLSEEQDKKFMTVHSKDAEGNLTATPMRMASPAEVPHPGGHFVYSTTEEYCQILLALINNGTHPVSKATILKPETVKEYLFKDQIPRVGCSNKGIGDVPSTLPPVTCTGAFLPGVDKGWSCGMMMNNEDTPNGRRKGSGAWAGLGNCYYWVDPSAGKLGFVMSAILPFFDRDVLHLFDALERAVYGKPMAKEVGEKGSNFEGGKYVEAAAA